jgi:hypothetical protein
MWTTGVQTLHKLLPSGYCARLALALRVASQQHAGITEMTTTNRRDVVDKLTNGIAKLAAVNPRVKLGRQSANRNQPVSGDAVRMFSRH